ncbi:ABC transporter permease [Opitutus sp. ER46]|uniref:ABC transporter permease n=1 Tax=Opitutus sp. ER46 TaxID=2161864 RepID=UPI000D31B9D1|nr:ABC transporter permease [Opitutus sp. ER46]PTY00076.1 ABC transporter [Opitutus sp. ER46]
MSRLLYELSESIRIAAAQIRASKMRSALTALGVVIGIVAVTLMGTAILGIDAGVERSLAGFGDDVLYVTKWPWRDVQDWWVYRNRREVDVSYAHQVNDWIAQHPEGPLKLAVPAASWNANVIRGDLRVVNIMISGTTADLGRIVRSDMHEGRFFTDLEARSGRNVAVIGFDVADALFPNESPIGKQVQIRSQRYTVVGVAARQGSFLGMFSWDSQVIMPLEAFSRSFPVRWADPEIRVQVDLQRMDEARDELRGVMRRVRRLSPEKKDDFEINSQQVVREQIEPMKKNIAIGGLFVTGLALFVGAIGIMNITYVSVKERTKEIGTRKALGARRRTILLQFLIEAVSICVLGGVLGLGTAWGLSALVGAFWPQFPIVFSFGLVLVGLTVSVVTGVFSGFAPAYSASKLDPVVALRYE